MAASITRRSSLLASRSSGIWSQRTGGLHQLPVVPASPREWKRAGSTAGQWSPSPMLLNGRVRASRTPLCRAVCTTIPHTHVLNADRPWNVSSLSMTVSQVSWTASWAAAALGV